MSKKAFIATILLSLFLISPLVGMQVVQVTKASPFLIYHQISSPLGTPPPKITMYSPQNNTAYSSDKITISFYVYYILIIFVNYTLDNQTVEVFSMWKNGTATSGWEIPEVNTTFTSPSLPAGNHCLTVAAKAVVYCGNYSAFFIDGSSTIFFSTGTQPSQQSISPTPTATPNLSPSSTCITLSPTLTPSPAHQETIEPSPTVSPPPIIEKGNANLTLETTGIIVIIAIAGVGLLAYGAKPKGWK